MDASLEFLQDSLVVTTFIAFVALTIALWLVAECKYLFIKYERSPEEAEGWEEMEEHYAGKELSIRDIIKNSTFRGFSAV